MTHCRDMAIWNLSKWKPTAFLYLGESFDPFGRGQTALHNTSTPRHSHWTWILRVSSCDSRGERRFCTEQTSSYMPPPSAFSSPMIAAMVTYKFAKITPTYMWVNHSIPNQIWTRFRGSTYKWGELYASICGINTATKVHLYRTVSYTHLTLPTKRIV